MRFTYEDTDLHSDSVLCEYLASTFAWGEKRQGRPTRSDRIQRVCDEQQAQLKSNSNTSTIFLLLEEVNRFIKTVTAS